MRINEKKAYIYSSGPLTKTIEMNSYLKMALTVCLAATALTAGTIAYALYKGPGTHSYLDDGVLEAFSSRSEVTDFLMASPSYVNGSAYYDVSRGAPAATGEMTYDSISYSTTNVQVAGVDESDIVKTDGEYIYAASSRWVSIVRAYPPEELANVTVLNATDVLGDYPGDAMVYISGLYLLDDRLVVVLSVYDYFYWYSYENYSDYMTERWLSNRAMVSVFDISDVANPVLEFSYGVSGYELSSRMIGSNLYLVAQTNVWIVDEEPLLPLLWVGTESSEFQVDKIYHDPATLDSSSFVDLLAVDIFSGEFEYKSIVGGYASVLYMSQDALYFTIQKWEGDVIVVGTEEEPEDETTTRTSIFKISVDGLAMVPAAHGSVKGWLLNQFSMDEYEGYMRVATTTSWTEPRNSVYVLDGDLSVVGALEGLAPTERIYSARFMGDTLYLVTFRQIDPLFVIDLSDPASPEVLGELKIPGFSSYLHPVGVDHVLGIGYENGSVKLTLFDVSDPTDPVEKSTYIAEMYSWTIATYDHKAVLFDLEKELLVIPMSVYGYDEYWNYSYWSGAYVFDVSIADGISLQGKISHNEVSAYDMVKRALYIGESLYTISGYVVKASSLDDLSEQGVLIYSQSRDYYYYVY